MGLIVIVISFLGGDVSGTEASRVPCVVDVTDFSVCFITTISLATTFRSFARSSARSMAALSGGR